MRRLLITKSEWSSLWLIILPIIFLIGSTYSMQSIYDSDAINSTKELTLGPVVAGIVSFQIIVGFTLNSSLFIGLPVREKEKGIKSILRSIGSKPIAYWLGTWIFDVMVFMILECVFVILLYVTSTPIISQKLLLVFIYITLFGGSLASYSYFWSIFFKVEKTAYKVYPIILIFFTSLTPGLLNLLLE